MLRSKDRTRWWKDGNADFTIPLPGRGGAPESYINQELEADEVSATIVDLENSPSWTLMHRFNAASDIVSGDIIIYLRDIYIVLSI